MNRRLAWALLVIALGWCCLGVSVVRSAPVFGPIEGNFIYEIPGNTTVADLLPSEGINVPEGGVVIYCFHTDAKGRVWSTY